MKKCRELAVQHLEDGYNFDIGQFEGWSKLCKSGYDSYEKHRVEAIQEKLLQNILETKEKILTAIQAGNAQDLANVLNNQYTYPEKVDLYYVQIEGQHYDGNYPCGTVDELRGRFHQRPMIEGIFFEEREFFIDLLKELKKLNGLQLTECFKALQNAMLGTDLDQEKFFTWNAQQQALINAAIRDMENYSKNYLQNQTDKSPDSLKNKKNKAIEELVINLSTTILSNYSFNEHPPTEEINKIDLAIQKLDFLNKLHKEDKLLNTARSNWRAITFNILVGLFTGPIGFVANKMVTGHYFFKFTTTSHDKVATIDNLVGYSPK